jgi:threonine dehydratase
MTESEILTLKDIKDAQEKIRNYLKPSPLFKTEIFNHQLPPETNLYLKMESLNKTGSFKERGACYKLLSLTEDEKKKGVIAASAGNHAQGVAYFAGKLGINATIVMPETTPLIKVSSTKKYGANVVLKGIAFDEAFAEATRLQKEKELVFIHPFNDQKIMAGQGTIGLEILEQNPYIDTVVVPIGGGGLISGVSCAIKSVNPNIKIVGVEPENIPSMKTGIENKSPILVSPNSTLADGLNVRIVGEETFKVAQKYVDEFVTVSEDEIANAILVLLERGKFVCEGAGATGVAAILSGKIKNLGKNVAVIISGGNIDVTMISKIIENGLISSGRLVRLILEVPDSPGNLGKITTIIGNLGANILELNHNRIFKKNLKYSDVIITLETKGSEHINKIIENLTKEGYKIKKDFE